MSNSDYLAVVCETLGPPESLRLRRLPRPVLTSGSVRVAIAAAGINFPDVLTMQGLYQHKPPLPFVPGVEAAGTIVEVAADIDRAHLGRKVIARMRTGAFAQEAVVPLDQTLPLPQTFSFAEGATYLVAHMTAYHGLVTRGAVAAGQTLLVLGAAGGVGLAAVQLGHVLGARVLAAASTEAKRQLALSCGAQAAIDYTAEPVEEGVKRLTGGKGVDAVFDPVGIAQDQATRCLAFGGKLLIAGFAGGTIPAYAANRVLLKGASVVGVRAGEAGRHDPALRQREFEALLAYAAQGSVRPHVSATFALAAYADALRQLQDRHATGRVAFAVNSP